MDRTDDGDDKGVRLKTGINLKELIGDEGITFELDADNFKGANEPEHFNCDSELLKFSNLECLGLDDEDTYNEEPFDTLSSKMTNLLPDGKIKKRILREGVGENLPENGLVTCDYNAFFEYNPEPFDSTYAFHRSFRFQLGSGNVLLGLDLAVQSMKINEKSQFLIHPDYAYGCYGCLDRIPPNSTILFEIEVKNCVNSGIADKYDEQGEKTFQDIYEYAEALRLKGNDLYKRNLLRQAIKEYNIAVAKLEKCQLKDYADQEKQQALLLKLYTNLVIVYTKKQLPRKVCISAKNINYLVKGTSLKIPVKVHFNHARALIMLGNLSEAEVKLKQAYLLEPTNCEIADEFIKLDRLKKESLARDKLIASALIKNNDGKSDKMGLSDDFKHGIDKTLADLISDPDWLQYKLHDNMTKDEIAYVKGAATERNLRFREEKKCFYVYKEESN